MSDRQYLRSVAASAAAAAGVLSALFVLLGWTGWPGALGLAAAVGLFLSWFYAGPRPDLAAKREEVPREGSDDE